MAKKQAVVRCDPDLLAECSELLEWQIGQKLPQATIASAALVALKNQHLHKLITESDCQTWSLKATVATCAEVLNLLMDAGLLEPASYEVEGIEGKGVRVLKDGKPLSGDKAEPTAPEWVNDVLNPVEKKQAIN